MLHIGFMFYIIYFYLFIFQVVKGDGDDKQLLTKRYSHRNHRSGSNFQPYTHTSSIAVAILFNLTMSQLSHLLNVDNKIYFMQLFRAINKMTPIRAQYFFLHTVCAQKLTVIIVSVSQLYYIFKLYCCHILHNHSVVLMTCL